MKHYPPNGELTTTNQHCQPLITNPKPTNNQQPTNQPPKEKVGAAFLPPLSPTLEDNFPAYTAKAQGSLLLSPFGVTTER